MMGEVLNPLFKLTEVEFFPRSNFAKRLTCKLCGQLIYELSDNSTKSDIDRELVGLRAHFEIAHGEKIVIAECSDPKCKEAH